jgi:23S rRNA (uridine2552-2'-O)-methyltransferase
VGRAGRVIALDLLEMAPIPGVEFMRGDFREDEVLRALEQRLGGTPVDLVISDMAPNMSGVPTIDQARSSLLYELALEFARWHLRPGGDFLVKAFHGAGFEELRAAMRAVFAQVQVRKPKASRDRSSEVYLLGRGKKG